MTIKEFAKLCECNPQTLRYYDSIDLLKPVKVDEWSGYRYYDKEQAIDYVKIKNLQKAGFTIDEIKNLVTQDDATIFNAFETKVREAEARLAEIKEIRQSYQSEMNTIKNKLTDIKNKILELNAKLHKTFLPASGNFEGLSRRAILVFFNTKIKQ